MSPPASRVRETGDKEQVAMETPCGKQERLIERLSFVRLLTSKAKWL
jgi:hypothetical protein